MTAPGPLPRRLDAAGQSWLIPHLAALAPDARSRLEHQLASLDLGLVGRLACRGPSTPSRPGALEPHPCIGAAERTGDPGPRARGERALRAGDVAFALLAGGQASRLGWDGPKGTYPVGPATKRSLFQILVEGVLKAERRYGAAPRLAVTTSPETDAAVREFFGGNGLFGYPPRRLQFVRQAMLPALDEDGRLLLAAPDRVFLSPDGHGGAVAALEREGILAEWAADGVTAVCTFQVDNALLRVVDPDFIGRVLEGGVDIATKVVRKTEPGQRLGVVARHRGRAVVVEYSEIGTEAAARRDADGALTFHLGSIAVHAFRTAFLRRELARELPLHDARREIPGVDERGRPVRRRGRKFERFVFDLFPAARAVRAVEVVREREYEPLKNAAGTESPETVRAALDREYRRWDADAGLEPPGPGPLEISPLDAEGPEDLIES
ncbi:MAG: UTP--glucose-1-phosphate uridylyltransferase [Planctomycetota bacterium]